MINNITNMGETLNNFKDGNYYYLSVKYDGSPRCPINTEKTKAIITMNERYTLDNALYILIDILYCNQDNITTEKWVDSKRWEEIHKIKIVNEDDNIIVCNCGNEMTEDEKNQIGVCGEYR